MSSEGNNRLLVIDDNPDIHRDFTKILTGGAGHETSATLDSLENDIFGAAPTASGEQIQFALTHCYQGQEGFEAVRDAKAANTPFVAAFVDMRMPPGWDGLRTIREIRTIDEEMTIVICTAYSDHSWHEIASQAGALDRLLILKKPFDPIELEQLARSLQERDALYRRAQMRTEELESLVRVRTSELEAARARNRVRLDELERVVEERTRELRKNAMTDRLTGLPNRAMLCDRMISMLARRDRDAHCEFALLFIDFDRFKVINDSLGHKYGDKLLTAISERLMRELRASDVVGQIEPLAARLGGDEFCILLESIPNIAAAEAVASRLVMALSQPYHLNGHEVVSTPSIGITTSQLQYASAEDMLRDADIAMYRAKHDGRARYVVFDRSMHEDAMKRQMLESSLPGAASRNELLAYYQPIVSLNDGSVTGVETLLRWNNPKCGMVPPNDFIPLAEETRDIIPIGEWVLRTACKQLAQWEDQLRDAAPYVSVNASRIQLTHEAFVRQLREAMTAIPFKPDRLVIEVTETALMQNPQAAERTLHAIRELGVQIFLDDFGSGFSSLGNLQRFPLNGIKLDRSFLDRSTVNRRSAAIIHSTVTLARDLNMNLIAEGVESLEHVALLQAIGCESAQGYLFSRPQPASEIPVGRTMRQSLMAA